MLLGLTLVDIITTLGCHLDVCLPDPRGCLTVAAMCNNVYTLSFEVDVVNFVSTIKHIVPCSLYNKHMRLKTRIYGNIYVCVQLCSANV